VALFSIVKVQQGGLVLVYQKHSDQARAGLSRLLSGSSQAVLLEVHCGRFEETSQSYPGIQLAGWLYPKNL
jgi:hypothetical protein